MIIMVNGDAIRSERIVAIYQEKGSCSFCINMDDGSSDGGCLEYDFQTEENAKTAMQAAIEMWKRAEGE